MPEIDLHVICQRAFQTYAQRVKLSLLPLVVQSLHSLAFVHVVRYANLPDDARSLAILVGCIDDILELESIAGIPLACYQRKLDAYLSRTPSLPQYKPFSGNIP